MSFRTSQAGAGQAKPRGQIGGGPQVSPAPAIEGIESQSKRTKLGSLLVLTVVLLIQIILEQVLAVPAIHSKLPAFLSTTAERILDGAIVAAIAAFLVETRLFKNYFEERLSNIVTRNQASMLERYESLLTEDFLKRIENVDYLRRFDNKTLDDAEEAIRRASFAPDLPQEVETFHRALREVRDQLDIWRTDYREVLVIEEYPGRPELCRVHLDTRWIFVNYNQEERSIQQRFTELANRINSVPDEDLYRITSVSIADSDQSGNLRCQLEPVDTDQVSLKCELDIRLPPMRDASKEGVPLHSTSEFVRPRATPITLRFFRPVYGLRLSLHALPGLRPTLHVFGVGSKDAHIDPLKPVEHHGSYWQWEYDGWFLPNHGLVLSFAQLGGGAPPPQSAAAVTHEQA